MAVSLGLFGLALLTKETAVGFAGVIFIYVAVFHEERSRRGALFEALRSSVPYAAVALLYLVIRRWVIGAAIVRAQPAASMATSLLTLPSVLRTYLRRLLVRSRRAA